MAWKAPKYVWPVLFVVLGLPVAAAATLSLMDGSLGSGKGTPASCDSGTPTIVQNVGTTSPDTTKIVSIDVSGIVSACTGGMVQVSLYNGTDTVEATKVIPAPGGSVNVTLSPAVPLTDSHFVAVTLQAP